MNKESFLKFLIRVKTYSKSSLKQWIKMESSLLKNSVTSFLSWSKAFSIMQKPFQINSINRVIIIEEINDHSLIIEIMVEIWTEIDGIVTILQITLESLVIILMMKMIHLNHVTQVLHHKILIMQIEFSLDKSQMMWLKKIW